MKVIYNPQSRVKLDKNDSRGWRCSGLKIHSEIFDIQQVWQIIPVFQVES